MIVYRCQDSLENIFTAIYRAYEENREPEDTVLMLSEEPVLFAEDIIVETENEKELWERLTAVEQSTKSAHHRLDSLDKLTESVHIIATETKAMRGDVNDITERVDEIEKRPTKRYETVVTAINTAIVGGLLGNFVKMLGF